MLHAIFPTFNNFPQIIHKPRDMQNCSSHICEASSQLCVLLWSYIPVLENDQVFSVTSGSIAAHVPCHVMRKIALCVSDGVSMMTDRCTSCNFLVTCGNHKSCSWWGGKNCYLSEYTRCHLVFKHKLCSLWVMKLKTHWRKKRRPMKYVCIL